MKSIGRRTGGGEKARMLVLCRHTGGAHSLWPLGIFWSAACSIILEWLRVVVGVGGISRKCLWGWYCLAPWDLSCVALQGSILSPMLFTAGSCHQGSVENTQISLSVFQMYKQCLILLSYNGYPLYPSHFLAFLSACWASSYSAEIYKSLGHVPSKTWKYWLI